MAHSEPYKYTEETCRNLVEHEKRLNHRRQLAALKVIADTPNIRAWLVENDLDALVQVNTAIDLDYGS